MFVLELCDTSSVLLKWSLVGRCIADVVVFCSVVQVFVTFFYLLQFSLFLVFIPVQLKESFQTCQGLFCFQSKFKKMLSSLRELFCHRLLETYGIVLIRCIPCKTKSRKSYTKAHEDFQVYVREKPVIEFSFIFPSLVTFNCLHKKQ